MSKTTAIQWTDHTWNPVRGCSRISEGCRNCYAEKIALRFSDPGQPFHLFADRRKSGSRWTGRVDLIESALMEPLKWRKPARIFVNSMSDLFHENLTDEAIDRVFAVMALCPRHTFQVLTKRAGRMREYFGDSIRRGFLVEAQREHIYNSHGRELVWYSTLTWPLPNVWLGVSVEDQITADARIPELLRTPAAKRFISYEPALGAISLSSACGGTRDFLSGREFENLGPHETDNPGLDWVIVGGESGPGARPMRIEWIERTISQCRTAGAACFVKQLGAYPVWAGARSSPATPARGKGGEMSEWPEDLQVREFPQKEAKTNG